MKRGLIVGVSIMLVMGLMLYASTRNASSNQVGGRVAQQAPDFTLKDLNGNFVHSSDFHGKAVVLNFWATWCPPCRVEIPWFIELQNKYGSQGLQIIGISMDEGGRDVVVRFAKQMGINYPVLLSDGEVQGVHDLPITLYIGRDGAVLRYVLGLMNRFEVEQSIRQALAVPSQTDQQARR